MSRRRHGHDRSQRHQGAALGLLGRHEPTLAQLTGPPRTRSAAPCRGGRGERNIPGLATADDRSAHSRPSRLVIPPCRLQVTTVRLIQPGMLRQHGVRERRCGAGLRAASAPSITQVPALAKRCGICDNLATGWRVCTSESRGDGRGKRRRRWAITGLPHCKKGRGMLFPTPASSAGWGLG
jgi:hypothetical protein